MQEEKDSRKFLTKAGKYSGLGISLLALILIPALAGNYLDHRHHNQIPWITLVLSLVGISLAFYYVFKELKN